MVRLLLSLFIGAVITFFLYVLMAFLVDGDDTFTNTKKEQIVIEINSTPPESKAQTRVRVPPPPPPPPPEPPKAPVAEPESTDTGGSIGFNLPSVDVGGTSNSGLGDPSSAMMRDGDATPIVRIEPKYPVQAARDGLQGWVKMRFTILEDGSVGDVEVVEAEPKRVFDREAIRALKRWKYSPKVVDGKTVKQPGIMVQLDFSLDQAGG